MNPLFLALDHLGRLLFIFFSFICGSSFYLEDMSIPDPCYYFLHYELQAWKDFVN